MSLLEDVFLQNEADEAQELERVIDGDQDDNDPRPSTPNSDENSEREDEAEEDKRRVDPSKAKEKRVVKNPRLILNPARLTGPRGIQIIPDHFKGFKFKGKGHEKEDLDLVLKRLEHWAYRLFPKFKFEDCLKKIETLGKKRPVMVHLQKIRSDQITSEETVVQRDSSDEEDTPMVQEEDEFDKLLQQQIELARATPAPGSVKKGFETPATDRSLLMPKATSSPSINEEQRERMLKNRQLAEERRLLHVQNTSIHNPVNNTSNNVQDKINKVNIDVNEDTVAENNRSNITDSSDEECDTAVVNQSITVDIHSTCIDKINNTKKDLVDKQTMQDLDVVCSGDIELIPTCNRIGNSVAQFAGNQIVLEDVACQGDVAVNIATNKIENTVAGAEVIQTNFKDTGDGQGNKGELNTDKNEKGNAVIEVEDNNMNAPTVVDTSEISNENHLMEDKELGSDTVLKDKYNSYKDNACTFIRMTDKETVMPNDSKLVGNESVDESDVITGKEKVIRDEKAMKINDDFGDDLDIMDVDFSEEF